MQRELVGPVGCAKRKSPNWEQVGVIRVGVFHRHVIGRVSKVLTSASSGPTRGGS